MNNKFNKFIAGILFILGLVLLYVAYYLYVSLRPVKEMYQGLDNPIPSEFDASALVVVILAITVFKFSLKFFLKK